MSKNISRRDFLNGVLLSSGTAAVLGSMPMRAFGAPSQWPADQVFSPEMARGGNQPSVFNVAHWLRDDRLSWKTNSVKLASSNLDNNSGTFPIGDEGTTYDLIIVGSGLSGLHTAYSVLKLKPSAKILILDGQATLGGNANRDEGSPLPVIGSTATAYAVQPYAPFLTDFYKDIQTHWENYVIANPVYSYFFDAANPFANPGVHSWNIDSFSIKGMSAMPYPAKVVNDLLASRQDFINWYNTVGAPTDPADMSDPKFDYLSPMTFSSYLTQVKGFSPAVVDFYDRYAVDALAGLCSQVTAYTSISFLGAEFFDCFAYPGGNSGIARHTLKYLIPGSIQGSQEADIINNPINYAACDQPSNSVRVRTNSLVLRGETGNTGAAVVYYRNGAFIRVKSKAVIFAGQMHTAHTATEYLMSAAQSDAADEVTLGPVVVANVALRSSAPIADLGYDAYYWGSQYWADFVVADWVSNRNTANRPTMLTFYGGNTAPVDEMPNERKKLLTTPFASYEDSLRADLNRVLAGRNFDFDRDVTAVYLYRWGHSMVFPKPGWPFGAPTLVNGVWQRTPSPRHIARAQLGRISYGAQDVESSPANESAIGAGVRTAQEVIGFL